MVNRDGAWNTLGEDAHAIDSMRYQNRCGVGELLRQLPPDARAYVAHVMTDDKLTHSAISKALSRRMENPPRAFSIGRHRRGDCQCSKAE